VPLTLCSKIRSELGWPDEPIRAPKVRLLIIDSGVTPAMAGIAREIVGADNFSFIDLTSNRSRSCVDENKKTHGSIVLSQHLALFHPGEIIVARIFEHENGRDIANPSVILAALARAVRILETGDPERPLIIGFSVARPTGGDEPAPDRDLFRIKLLDLFDQMQADADRIHPRIPWVLVAAGGNGSPSVIQVYSSFPTDTPPQLVVTSGCANGDTPGDWTLTSSRK
jgi:hypothetical protein